MPKPELDDIDEVADEFQARELLVTNRLVLVALYSRIEAVAGPRGRAIPIQAGRTIAEWLDARSLDQGLELLHELTGLDYETDDGTVTITNCPECLGLNAEKPICYIMSGYISACVEAETGKPVRVVEKECKASGDEACVFEIGGEDTGEFSLVDLDEYCREAIDAVPRNLDPYHVAAFKVLSEQSLRDVLGPAERTLFFQAGRAYARALWEAFDRPDDPRDLVEKASKRFSAADYELEGDRAVADPCLECAGVIGNGPMCHAVRGAFSEVLDIYGIPYKGIEEARCAAAEGELIGRCEMKISGVLWKAKKVVDKVLSIGR
ncbi:MAG: hypothetical protein GXO28_06415 [Methanopyri archaeon]|nr:hypothetical protein [Methanopyri archaeon]